MKMQIADCRLQIADSIVDWIVNGWCVVNLTINLQSIRNLQSICNLQSEICNLTL